MQAQIVLGSIQGLVHAAPREHLLHHRSDPRGPRGKPGGPQIDSAQQTQEVRRQGNTSPPRRGLSSASPKGTVTGERQSWRSKVMALVLRGKP